jgi:hypothetical protein
MMTILGPFLPYIIAGLGAVAAIFGYGYSQKRKGRAIERAKQAKATAEAHEARDEAEEAISGRTDEENRKRLGEWTRN